MKNADAVASALERIVGKPRMSTETPELESHSRDMWPRLLLLRQTGHVPDTLPQFVVWPESPREVAAIIRLAREHKVPVTPYAGGSGVCGGAVPLAGGISLDLKRMNSLLSIDSDNLRCEVQAGMNGERFERQLARHGLTFGNFPSSIYCSTVGGWMATRAAGQMSTKYGKADQRVLGLTFVTGRGDIVNTKPQTRAHAGPNWTQLLLGSEGTLGVVCAAELQLSVAPTIRILRGYRFADVLSGVEGIRAIMQRGLSPAVIRLYDEMDTLLHVFGSSDEDDEEDDKSTPSKLLDLGGEDKALLERFSPSRLMSLGKKKMLAPLLSASSRWTPAADLLANKVVRKGCRMIIGFEGARIRTEVEANIAFKELDRLGAEDLGEEPGQEWLEKRYAVSYKMSPVFASGAMVDTLEVVSTWSRLPDLYFSVRDAIRKHAFVMAHFSHAYHEGCSIYFTFATAAQTRDEAESTYDRIWSDAMHATNNAGGSISHHHGIGLVRGRFMRQEHREGFTILESLKRVMDPQNIMNPGKLGFAK